MSWWKEDDPALSDIHWEPRLVPWRIYFKMDLKKVFQRSDVYHSGTDWAAIDTQYPLPLWLKQLSERGFGIYLARISSSSPEASTDHVCCDVSVKGLAAVTPRSWNDGHRDRPQGGRGLAYDTKIVVAPAGHPAQQAVDHSCPRSGEVCQWHVPVQHHGGPQLDRGVDTWRKSTIILLNMIKIYNIIMIISKVLLIDIFILTINPHKNIQLYRALYVFGLRKNYWLVFHETI